jgi:hypothetical protein
MPLFIALTMGFAFIWRVAHLRVTLLQAARYGASVEAAGGSGSQAIGDFLKEELDAEQGVVASVTINHAWPLVQANVMGYVRSWLPGTNPIYVRATAAIGERMIR